MTLTRQQRRKMEREQPVVKPWMPMRPCERPEAPSHLDDVFYQNDIYRVAVRTAHDPLNDRYVANHFDGWLHLMICRHDNRPVDNWQHKQRIKDELVGPECEGVEMFPAYSRVLDVGNVYHLWVNPDPKFRMRLGYATSRRVMSDWNYEPPTPLRAATVLSGAEP